MPFLPCQMSFTLQWPEQNLLRARGNQPPDTGRKLQAVFFASWPPLKKTVVRILHENMET